MYEKKFFASSKQLKLCPRDLIFPTEKEGKCNNHPLCFMYNRVMLNDIIVHLFSYITKKNGFSEEIFISKNPG